MKKITTFIALLFFTLHVIGQNYKYVNTEGANVRESAGKQYEIVGQVTQGEKVTVISESKSWTQIVTTNGVEGYIASNFLSTNSETEQKKKTGKSPWSSIIFLLVLLVIGFYKVKKFFADLFGSNNSKSSTPKKSSSKSYSAPKQTDIFHLTIKDGVVNLGKEGSTMQQTAFHYFDKAIDCDLENPKDERSRFLVVTTKGEVFLCKLNNTGKKSVFRPFVAYGSAYKARFTDSNSFYFQTEKGSYKGYFNNTGIDKL